MMEDWLIQGALVGLMVKNGYCTHGVKVSGWILQQSFALGWLAVVFCSQRSFSLNLVLN